MAVGLNARARYDDRHGKHICSRTIHVLIQDIGTDHSECFLACGSFRSYARREKLQDSSGDRPVRINHLISHHVNLRVPSHYCRGYRTFTRVLGIVAVEIGVE